jgi:D-3-phosphoglycerate dehydrogenase
MLICDECPVFFMDALSKKGYELEYRPMIDNQGLYDLPNEYQAILIKSVLQLHERFFAHFSAIQLVLRPGSGLDNIDMAYCKEHHIHVINSPEGNANAVGEHTLGLLLCLANNLVKAVGEARRHAWIREENRGIELQGRAVGVIGVGHTGLAFCNKIRGFEVKLLPHDKYKYQVDGLGTGLVPLEQVFAEAEMVSLHLPLNPETYHYANDAFFDAFDRPIYFINTSRGAICHLPALYRAMERGKVLKAALDVLEKEPLIQNSDGDVALIDKMLESERAIVTPHIAGWTYEARDKMHQFLLQKMGVL